MRLIAGEWKVFYRLYLQIGLELEYYRGIREWVFKLLCDTAAKFGEEPDSTEVLYYRGISHLMNNETHEAVSWIQKAVAKEPENQRCLAALAACWEHLGHDFQARLLFRETFYQAPDEVEYECLRSQIIDAVIEKITKFQYPVNSIRYWIPVFGRIFGFFNVKRALTTLEYSNLVKQMRALEHKLEGEGRQQDPSLLPMLINCYLWMIDYHVSLQKYPDKITEIETQLREADYSVYQLYIEHAHMSK